jgi:hypothetical protein
MNTRQKALTLIALAVFVWVGWYYYFSPPEWRWRDRAILGLTTSIEPDQTYRLFNPLERDIRRVPTYTRKDYFLKGAVPAYLSLVVIYAGLFFVLQNKQTGP